MPESADDDVLNVNTVAGIHPTMSPTRTTYHPSSRSSTRTLVVPGMLFVSPDPDGRSYSMAPDETTVAARLCALAVEAKMPSIRIKLE